MAAACGDPIYPRKDTRCRLSFQSESEQGSEQNGTGHLTGTYNTN